MSKSQLKKELAKMTAGQIGELLLDLYDARPEAKEYLDFFVKPDIDARLEKARTAIKKEVARSSRGRSKMRSTRLRRLIKDISSLNPGPEPVCEIMTYTIVTVCALDSDLWIKDTTKNAIARLLHDTIVEADRAGLLNIHLPRLEKALKSMPSPLFRTNHLKTLLTQTLASTLQSL